jgi:hypothetical protein
VVDAPEQSVVRPLMVVFFFGFGVALLGFAA